MSAGVYVRGGNYAAGRNGRVDNAGQHVRRDNAALRGRIAGEKEEPWSNTEGPDKGGIRKSTQDMLEGRPHLCSCPFLICPCPLPLSCP